MVFDKMPESETLNLSGVGVDFLLQLKMGKVSYKLVVGECLFVLFDSAHRVFDRGKGFQLIGWILIWISTIVFGTGLKAREKDVVLRIPVKISMGNIRYLVFNTADTVYHRVCRVQLRASSYHVLLSLDAWGVCFDRLLMEANTSAIFYGESLKLHVGLHEQGQGTQIIWMPLKLCKLLLLTVTIVRRLVYPLSRNCPGPSQEIYDNIQVRHKSNQAIQRPYWFVCSTLTYFLTCCGRLLRVHRGSEYLGRIPVYRDAKGDVLLILVNKVVYMLVNFLVSIIYLLRIWKDFSCLDCVLKWRMGIQLKLVVVQDPQGLFYLSRIRTDYSCFDCVLAWKMGIQLKLVVVQDPEGLSLMVSLRCTFKLFPTVVCSVRVLFRFYGRVVGMHAATARANSSTASPLLLFSFKRQFTWFFSIFWSEENVIIVGVVDVSILAIPILTIGIVAIPGWRMLTVVGINHLSNGVVRTVQVQKGDNTTCKDREPGVVQTDLMATFKWMEVYRDVKGEVLLILLNKVVYMLVYFLVSIICFLRIGKDYSCLDCVLKWRTGIELKLVVVQDPEGLFYFSRIGTDYSCLDCVLAWRMGIQFKLMVVQNPEGLLLKVSLRCTFKLFPTGLCSMRILIRFYGRVVGMHAATARANSSTALALLLFSFKRQFTWFFSSFWSEENVIIVGVVDVGIVAIPVWRILTMAGLKHLANWVIRTVQVQKGDNTTCKDREPRVVQTDLMATFKWMEVISGDLLDDSTVCIIYPISSTTTLQLVVSFMWNFTLSCVANRNWELVGIFNQVVNLDVFSRWPLITEVCAVSFNIIFIYKARISNAVPELLEWLASNSSIPCQVLTAEEMVNKLRHLTWNKVKTDGKRGVYALSFDMIFIYEVRVSNAVPEQLEWLASKSFISCQILEAEEIWNQLLHLIFCKVKTNGERGVCMSASQEEICEGIGSVYSGEVSTAQESRIHWLVSMGKL